MTNWAVKTPQTNIKPEKHKNVLVIYSHNISGHYLSSQFIDPMAGNADSAACFKSHRDNELTYRGNDGGGIASFTMNALRSADGIQFFHFKGLAPKIDAGNNSVAPYVDAMEAYINQRGEKLDAIVIPHGWDNHESSETLEWMAKMKERFPGVKIMVDGANLQKPSAEERERYAKSSYVIANDPSRDAGERDKAFVTKGNPDYTLAAPIDAVAISHEYTQSESADQLRALIDMPPYREAAVDSQAR